MSMYKNLMTVCCAAALALGLAACGGGGGDSSSSAVQTGGGGTTPAPVGPADPTAESLKATAADAITAAIAAAEEAAQAKTNAIKYAGMLDAGSVDGDSAKAAENAQKVLDAEMTVTLALMDADDALSDAMRAKDDAEALPEDDEGRDGAIAAADEAIKQAAAQKKAIMDIVDEAEDTTTDAIDSLKGAVAAVEGTDADMPNDAAHHGQQVAMAVGEALGPSGGGTRVTHATTPPADTVMGAVKMDDHTGMTWAEIVGEHNVMMKRLGTDNAEVPVASMAGLTAADSIDSFDPNSLPTAIGSAGDYMGIPGTVYCLGTDCEVDANGELAGSWYFSPTSPAVFYEIVGEATDYTAETNYARFGHWLTYDDSNGQATINTYATGGVSGTNTSGLDVTTVNTGADDPLTDTEATYEGRAVGMSLHKDVDAHGNPVKGSLSSGAFEARVRLTAKFDASSPMLGGTIDRFTSVNGGNNVDSAWSVKLAETAFTGAAVSGGVADASGPDGLWTAQGYGTSGQRPVGIYGGFQAHFTDGHAAGAYATRKK